MYHGNFQGKAPLSHSLPFMARWAALNKAHSSANGEHHQADGFTRAQIPSPASPLHVDRREGEGGPPGGARPLRRPRDGETETETCKVRELSRRKKRKRKRKRKGGRIARQREEERQGQGVRERKGGSQLPGRRERGSAAGSGLRALINTRDRRNIL